MKITCCGYIGRYASLTLTANTRLKCPRVVLPPSTLAEQRTRGPIAVHYTVSQKNPDHYDILARLHQTTAQLSQTMRHASVRIFVMVQLDSQSITQTVSHEAVIQLWSQHSNLL